MLLLLALQLSCQVPEDHYLIENVANLSSDTVVVAFVSATTLEMLVN